MLTSDERSFLFSLKYLTDKSPYALTPSRFDAITDDIINELATPNSEGSRVLVNTGRRIKGVIPAIANEIA